MHITIKHGFKLLLSSEWNVESVQNLKFPEDMIEVTQIASFLYEINFEAQKTIIGQDRTSDQSIKQKYLTKATNQKNECKKQMCIVPA